MQLRRPITIHNQIQKFSASIVTAITPIHITSVRAANWPGNKKFGAESITFTSTGQKSPLCYNSHSANAIPIRIQLSRPITIQNQIQKSLASITTAITPIHTTSVKDAATPALVIASSVSGCAKSITMLTLPIRTYHLLLAGT